MSADATQEPEAQDQARSLRRYAFEAERVVHVTEYTDIKVIAESEDEAWEEARGQLDDGDVEWDEGDRDEEGDELSLNSVEDLTEREIEEYMREKQEEEEAIRAAEDRTSRRQNLRNLLVSLRAASDEERVSLIDDLEMLID